MALSAPVGAFLDYGPDEGRADVLDAWAAVPESARPIALEVMQAFTGPRSPGTSAGQNGYHPFRLNGEVQLGN